MASTNRTPNLGLSAWLETDKPKRLDFVSDNSIIDSALGSHLGDTTAHLTQSEKNKVTQPFAVEVFYGTGSATGTIRYDFEPNMVLAFKKNAPFTEYSNSKNKINSATATKRGSTSGISLSADLVTLYQGAVADTNYYNNMNEQYAQYIVIAFK